HGLRDPQRLFALAPLAEELLPLLLVGRDGSLTGADEPDRAKWVQLLQALSRALVANLSMARAESPPIVQAFARDAMAGPLPPVLNAPAAAVLGLATRLLAALPRELWTAEVVPAVLTDTLAAIARDEVLTALLPGVRRTLLPLLAVLRPDVTILLEVAAAGEAALAAGEAAMWQLPALHHGGELATMEWLRQLYAALPALYLPGQDSLLEGLVQGLALVCGSGDLNTQSSRDGASASPRLGPASPSAEGGAQGRGRAGICNSSSPTHQPNARAEAQWVQQSEEVFLALLSHSSPSVAMACYSLLEGLLADGRAQPGQPLLRLLARRAVVERLVVLGLSDERTRRQVARILMGVLPDVDMQSCIRPWSFWIRLYAADPQVGALAASLEASERRCRERSPSPGGRWGGPEVQDLGAGAAAPPFEWSWLRGLLLELYSADAERRRAAARHLSEDLKEANVAVFAAPHDPHVIDPFRVCLDSGVRDDLVVPAANPRLARSFRPADVSNLLAILANGELALELRRSAAEQMLALAAEERLREVLEQEASVYVITCVAALRDPATGSSLTASQVGAPGSQGLVPPTPDLLSTLDVQLPLAAVNLLFVLAAHSPKTRAWLVSERSLGAAARQAGGPDSADTGALTGANTIVAEEGRDEGDSLGGSKRGGGLEMIVGGILPMVFHSMVTVRRAVARLLAALCFGSQADRWSGWSALATGPGPRPEMTPSAAARQWAAAAPTGAGRTSSAGDVLLLPYPFQRCYGFPCRVTWVRLPPACQPAVEEEALEGKPRLQDLLSEQRHLVVLLIQERQALNAAGGDLSRLLALMNDRPDCLGGLPPAAQHTLAASVRAVAPGGLVSRSLAAVRAATSHQECTVALRELQLAVYSRQGAAALAAVDWQVHFEALLSTSPISPEDHALWVELLQPLRRALASGGMSHAQLVHLAEYLAGSALDVLSAPEAAVEPPGLPVALAGSAMLSIQPDQHSQLLCTLTVLATLVDLVRFARTRLPAHQGLRVLAALSLPKLLRTLGVAYLDNAAASYGCRAQAVQLLQEVTLLLTMAMRIGATTANVTAPAGDGSDAAATAAAAPEVLSLDVGLAEALLLCLKALL
ncbi:hypothetical protein VaNZ11_003729, partial [Volvox africanus]